MRHLHSPLLVQVSGRQRVLGVVGRGHLAGVMRALGERETYAGTFKSLVWTPRRAAAKRKVLGLPEPLVRRLAFDLVLGVGIWLAFFQ